MDKEDNNYLFELIQGIQSKLSEEKPPSPKEEKNNIEYMQENFFKNEQKKESKKENNNFNISDVLNNLNLAGLFGSNESGFDVNTMMKIQKILSSMSKDDPRKNLLISLKPFLRKSRQEKINEYLTYLTIGSALGIFDDKGSGNNVT
ncbi:MAG: hypothetical protein K0R72_870 [Clostridia bacterium]|jgi:hypothetical protein|nr:hypothetical protein [Clostridia bacterium]